jgi:hypothetical protein
VRTWGLHREQVPSRVVNETGPATQGYGGAGPVEERGCVVVRAEVTTGVRF